MRLERSSIETEDDGKFNWDFNGQTQVIVVNQNETNQYGEYRGYRSRLSPRSQDFHMISDDQTLANKEHNESRIFGDDWDKHLHLFQKAHRKHTDIFLPSPAVHRPGTLDGAEQQ